MRPKKVVLYIDAKPVRQSITRFVLTVRGFRVASYESPELARKHEGDVSVVLVYGTRKQVESAIYLAAVRQIRTVHVDPSSTTRPAWSFAECVITGPESSMERIVNTLKIASVRNRGPRKGSKRKPVAGIILAEIPKMGPKAA